jgi:hypothetical protein
MPVSGVFPALLAIKAVKLGAERRVLFQGADNVGAPVIIVQIQIAAAVGLDQDSLDFERTITQKAQLVSQPPDMLFHESSSFSDTDNPAL